MDRSRNGEAWLDQLAPLHASVLRLASQGSDSEAIAARLGVLVESVPGLVEMAAAKLARIARERSARRTTRAQRPGPASPKPSP